MITDPLLTVTDVSVAFHQYVGLLRRRHVVQLDNVSMDLAAGEILAVVGASGAGKSLLADVILGLLPPNAHVSARSASTAASLSTPTARAGSATSPRAPATSTRP